jgi:hypothetical protein
VVPQFFGCGRMVGHVAQQPARRGRAQLAVSEG